MLETMKRAREPKPTGGRRGFAEELGEALAVERQYRQLQVSTATRHSNMPTPRAAIARSLATAKATREGLGQVATWAASTPLAQAWIGAAHAHLRGSQWGSEVHDGLISFLGEEDRPVLVSLLSGAGVRMVELAAYAVVTAAEQSPNWFGLDDEDDPHERTRERAAITARREALRATLGRQPQDYAPGDLVFTDFDRDGRARIAFAVAPAVSIWPPADAGGALIDHLMARG